MSHFERASVLVALLALFLLGAVQARADTLYAATGSTGVNGELYILNPANGAVITDVGALVDSGGHHYGLTGLAFHPTTGVLYGSTARKSPTSPGHLVIVNPATALVTDVGSFGVSGSPGTFADITFDPTTGTLYGQHAPGDDWLYTINLTTGTATKVGTGTCNTCFGEGLAADASGTIWGTPDGCGGHLDTFSKTNGVMTVVAPLSGCPFGSGNSSGINSLAFDSTGTLYGINNNEGRPSLCHLVIINTTTGVVTDQGASVDNLDALAFRPVPAQDVYTVDYYANAHTAGAPDGTLQLVNDGNAGDASPAGDLCAAIYVFDDNENMQECCSCRITPNGYLSLSINSNLTANNPPNKTLHRGVIKILSSAPSGGLCDPTTTNIHRGIHGWLTHIEKVGTGFDHSTEDLKDSALSPSEAGDLAGDCSLIRSAGHGVTGVCSCTDAGR
jgi:hypothetical protein